MAYLLKSPSSLNDKLADVVLGLTWEEAESLRDLLNRTSEDITGLDDVLIAVRKID